MSVGSEVMCKVDYERRANVAPNHTMTHVLNFALRKVGGYDNSVKNVGVLQQRE